MVMMSRYKYLKLVHAYLCSKLLAGSAEMRWTDVTHHAYDVYSGGSHIEISRRFWI